jgi:trk system potassium uptake protein TrkH
MAIRHHTNPGRKLIIGFFGIIVLGGFLLSLPFSQTSSGAIPVLDAYFISTSAVCVTGLSTVNISQALSLFGRIILALLMQLGGIGYATFSLFLHVLLRQRISLAQRILAREALNQETGMDIIGLVRLVTFFSLGLEGVGTLLLFIAFNAKMDAVSALGMGLFHAISAYNNAGFDLFGNSFCNYSGNVLVNLTVIVLIVLGGIGFFVISDVLSKKRWKHFTFHSKIVISTTLILILAGMVLLHFTSGISWLESLFLSVSTRTAGFNSVDTGALAPAALTIAIILMWIGASSGSTGGGIKTTTFFTIITAMRAVVTRREPSAFHRKIALDSILKAFCVAFLSLAAIMIAVLGLCQIEGERFSFVSLLFEAVSAISTTGLSCGITGDLQSGSKWILMLLMFIGRLGPLTIVGSLSMQKQSNGIHCVEEHIIIG